MYHTLVSFSFKKIGIQYFKYRTIHNVNIHEDALRQLSGLLSAKTEHNNVLPIQMSHCMQAMPKRKEISGHQSQFCSLHNSIIFYNKALLDFSFLEKGSIHLI